MRTAPTPASNPTIPVLMELLDERLKQDVRWGGPEHDDTHTLRDWLCFLDRRIEQATDDGLDGPPLRSLARRNLVELAALAIATIEWLDRRPVSERLREGGRPMIKEAHTPGPWVAVESNERTPLAAGMAIAVHRATAPWSKAGGICEMLAQPGASGYYSAEATTATAVLIAAAPDLLLALHEMVNRHESADEEPGYVTRAREVIARAEGR